MAPDDVVEQASNTGTEAQQEWWSAPPNQTATPRKSGMSPGEAGNYLDSGDLTQSRLTESRVGPPTAVGGAARVPTVPPRVSYALLALNLAVYGWGVALALGGEGGGAASNDYFLALANEPGAVAAGEYGRLLSSTFLHAGLLHLGLNCAALWQLGPEVEGVMGYATFTAVYLMSGLAGSTASFMLSDLTTVGASGAIFGLLGALSAYFARNRDLQNSGRQLVFIGLLLALNLVLGAEEGAMIDNTGHIAGFIAGAWLGWGMGPRYVTTREVDVPDGSMTVPDDAPEVQVVVDQTTDLQRAVVAASFGFSLVVAVGAGIIARSQGL